jgi:hypothetical protein
MCCDFRKDVMRFSKASGSSLDAEGIYNVARSHACRVIFSVYTFFKSSMYEVEWKKTTTDFSRRQYVEAYVVQHLMEVGRL